MSDSIVQHPDHEYETLRIIEELSADRNSTEAGSQRDIAKALNLSVGMTNAIIKRLAAKGWLVMNRINGRNLSYALTPEGTREVARRGYRYLRRTIGNVVRWKDAIDREIMHAKEAGCSRVLLLGVSDLDFIVEHAADRHGLVFIKSADVHSPLVPGQTSGRLNETLVLLSERLIPSDAEDLPIRQALSHTVGGEAPAPVVRLTELIGG